MKDRNSQGLYRHRATVGNIDAEVRHELHERTGAALIGRTMFDVGEEPWGPDPPFAMPVGPAAQQLRFAQT